MIIPRTIRPPLPPALLSFRSSFNARKKRYVRKERREDFRVECWRRNCLHIKVYMTISGDHTSTWPCRAGGYFLCMLLGGNCLRHESHPTPGRVLVVILEFRCWLCRSSDMVNLEVCFPREAVRNCNRELAYFCCVNLKQTRIGLGTHRDFYLFGG